MEFTQLKYFQEVARTENISRAAAELYVTQPNLSKSIKRLEEEIGVPLFDHRKGKIVLNEYGRIFLASVNAGFEEFAKGTLAVRRLYDSKQNFLLLGSSVNDFLPDMLRDFSAGHPDIGIRQVECSLKNLRQFILDGTIDIGITSVDFEDSNFEFELLGKMDFVILTGPSHPLAQKSEISISELSNESFICDSSRLDRAHLVKICNDNGFEPKITFDLENSDLIYSLLMNNDNICFMPGAQMVKINHYYPNSGIHMLKIKDEIPPAVLGITYRKDYVFSNAAKVLLEFIHQWINREHMEFARYIQG